VQVTSVQRRILLVCQVSEHSILGKQYYNKYVNCIPSPKVYLINPNI